MKWLRVSAFVRGGSCNVYNVSIEDLLFAATQGGSNSGPLFSLLVFVAEHKAFLCDANWPEILYTDAQD